ncbi:L-cysteine:1D-myo-inositol 2-amino-2-deoxy-alpha-D-glucopyranoside ligase [Actinomadura rubteroloni]|uniref:L-cysteine:1D-myo-inositol 2-amino-2-deoxy-alpha-D-glucopyranoside ligase n=1 Tax=Actinomadura rubteroloni TaxID=1926885 RepID=A0A2P4UIY9_9ACTN|nr:hypothetical protein [Actinomadura rubteroloni]POM25023.1 L-cysteine:1D-myo-inositol 2-amino-2-deoxy-alpha-D-glucopyranoside ligase [Actinomadura rubteroloni]
MLRLRDADGELTGLPGGPVLRIRADAGPRGAVVADVLRRAAERGGRRVLLALPGDFTALGVAPSQDFHGEPDVVVGPGAWPDVPPASGSADGPGARLAVLATPYREPLDLTPSRLAAAAARLDAWRTSVAAWAREPGRPLDRASVRAAETALADDLDVPAALAVLDRVAASDLAPGAKLETFIALDLLLGLNLVAAIGR